MVMSLSSVGMMSCFSKAIESHSDQSSHNLYEPLHAPSSSLSGRLVVGGKAASSPSSSPPERGATTTPRRSVRCTALRRWYAGTNTSSPPGRTPYTRADSTCGSLQVSPEGTANKHSSAASRARLKCQIRRTYELRHDQREPSTAHCTYTWQALNMVNAQMTGLPHALAASGGHMVDTARVTHDVLPLPCSARTTATR